VVRDHLIEAHFMASDARILQERMRQIPEYEQTFIELMGGEASFGKVRSALVAYLESLRSENNPYLNFAAGDTSALSDAAQRGLTLFNGTAGCSTCHNGELLSDGQTHVTGVADNPNIFSDPDRHISFRRFFRQFGVGEFVTLREDLGEFALTHDDEDRGAFRTPSLLEVGQTAPYMHNGTLGTLEDVVKFYNFGGDSQELAPLGLTDAEINDLVAFLSSLQSDITPVDPPVLPDYEIRELGVN
jgi:cytochrome c peroxidase